MQNQPRPTKKIMEQHFSFFYTLMTVRAMLLVLSVGKLVFDHGIADCARMKREMELRSKINLGNYYSVYPTNSTFIESNMTVFQMINGGMVSDFKDPN